MKKSELRKIIKEVIKEQRAIPKKIRPVQNEPIGGCNPKACQRMDEIINTINNTESFPSIEISLPDVPFLDDPNSQYAITNGARGAIIQTLQELRNMACNN